MVNEILFPLEIDPKRKIGAKTEAQLQAEIEAKARELCKGAKGDFEKCKAIYEWLRTDGGGGKFAYKSFGSDVPKRAVQTFADREGDCDDLAYLFMAMASAVGVKAAVAKLWALRPQLPNAGAMRLLARSKAIRLRLFC